jgi:hypothetical protein
MIKITMTVDNWIGAISKNMTLENAEWSDIEGATRMLNQSPYSQLVLRRGDGAELLLGGGNGEYVLSISETEDKIANLVDDAKRGQPKTKVITGGQAGLFPAHYVVGLGVVLDALRGFIEEGRPIPRLTWEVQPLA